MWGNIGRYRREGAERGPKARHTSDAIPVIQSNHTELSAAEHRGIGDSLGTRNIAGDVEIPSSSRVTIIFLTFSFGFKLFLLYCEQIGYQTSFTQMLFLFVATFVLVRDSFEYRE